MSVDVYLVAAEDSGDALGADLIAALRARRPELSLAAVGGPAMARAGAASRIKLDDLAVFGLVDGLLAYRRVVRQVERVVEDVLAARPRVLVLIDSWGFTLRVAQAVKTRAPATLIVKYVGPQVWASRPGRAKTLAGTVDHLICLLPNEPAFYEPLGLPCTVCGHPAIGRYRPGDGAAFRSRRGIGADETVLLVLPGSRKSELRRTAPVLEAAAARVHQAAPVRFISVAAPSVAAEVARRAAAWPFPAEVVSDPAERDDAFAAADVALAASGTVTTEAALQGAALVVGYRIGWLTWAVARAVLMKSRYITLINVIADAEVAPEFVQTRCTPRALARAALRLVQDKDARARQVTAQAESLRRMGLGGRKAQDIAAEAVLAQMDGRASDAMVPPPPAA